jgi:hypothetical protein
MTTYNLRIRKDDPVGTELLIVTIYIFVALFTFVRRHLL